MKAEIEQRLIVDVAAGLQNVTVGNDLYLEIGEFAWVNEIQKWLPDEITKKIVRFCGGTDLTRFFQDEITRILSGRYVYREKDDRRLLSSYPEFSKLIDFSKKIVHRLKSLPYRYTATVGLPIAFSKELVNLISVVHLSDAVSLREWSMLPQVFPVKSTNPLYDKSLFTDWLGETSFERDINHQRIYFHCRLLGYSGSQGSGMLARELEDNLKAMYGALIALGVMRHSYHKEDAEPAIMIHRVDPDVSIIATETLERELWESRSQLSISKAIENKSTTEAHNILSPVSQVFQDGPSQKRLFTACIWFFRATLSERPLDTLLEATIAIEVMLGDKSQADGVGLTTLLANRCAYLLGNSQAEREEIMRSFVSIYGLRSSIVHAGKHRATLEERKTIQKATSLCGRIIAHEIMCLQDLDVPF